MEKKAQKKDNMQFFNGWDLIFLDLTVKALNAYNQNSTFIACSLIFAVIWTLIVSIYLSMMYLVI